MRYYETTQHGLYRSRDGMFFGVCRGLADHLDISAFWIRAIAVVTVLCSGFFPGVVAYLFAALIMKKEPYGYWYR